jgi:large subunit ribosomal protein L23
MVEEAVIKSVAKPEVKKEVPKNEKSKTPTKFPLIDPWSIVVAPLLTEKAIGMIEKDNKLVFIVNRKSSKSQIKWAVQKIINGNVQNVQTLIDRKGRKKAFVKLDKKTNASDIATRFGML